MARVVILRAYSKYIRQMGVMLSEPIQQTLANNAGITRLLLQLFVNNFDPSLGAATRMGSRHAASLGIRSQIEDARSVSNPDEDRILRLYVTLIDATLRTNYFLRKPYLSFKVDSQKIADCPRHGRCSRSSSIRR
jgi:glutamate dehydrogenase